eukprot:354123-Chlamydomonas_euryale.AAC.1
MGSRFPRLPRSPQTPKPFPRFPAPLEKPDPAHWDAAAPADAVQRQRQRTHAGRRRRHGDVLRAGIRRAALLVGGRRAAARARDHHAVLRRLRVSVAACRVAAGGDGP